MSSPPPLPSPSAAPVPPVVAVLPVLADFGDWLSPMIVKELRQGLRTWIFVGAFIVLQAILIMTLLIAASSGNQEASSYLFWILIAIILVFIVPLRGFNALAGEMKAQTLDTLMLTRLSAFRIAVGKWVALVAQSALIAISVLPYVVLRYFGGGVDMVAELRALLLFWMLSAGVTGIAVAFSAVPSIIIRTLVLLGTWWWAAMACGAISITTIGHEDPFSSIGSGGSSGQNWWIALAIIVPLWAYSCYFVLDLGASAIAPLAANHATRKRLISLALMGVAFGCAMLLPSGDGRGIAMVCLVGLWGLCSLDCLTETPTAAPSVFLPFVRFGPLGRLAACFLSPGWPTGLLFYVATCGLVGIAYLRIENGNLSHRETLFALNVAFLAPTPLALALLFFRKSHRLLGPYLVGGMILGIVSALLLFMMEIGHEDGVALAGVTTPMTALILGSNANGETRKIVFIGGVIAGIIWFVFVLIKATPHYRAMAKAMRDAAASGKRPSTGEV